MRYPASAPFLCGAVLVAALAACNGGPSSEAYIGPVYYDAGGSDTSASTCASGGTCDAAPSTGCDGSCLPPESVGAGKPCTFTADCKLGFYCGADGTCDATGDGSVGATCTTSGSCVRGAVCYRATPGLYGVCTLPLGTSISASGDGGPDGAGGAAGLIHGDAGTAHGINGACTNLLDCLAGLACSATTHTCQAGVPGAGLPLPWAGVACNDALPADAGVGGVRAYFEVPAGDGTPPYDFFRLPFPNDIRRDPTTHHPNLTGFPDPGTAVLGFDIVQRYVQASQTDLDGFGLNQDIYFRFSAAIDLNSLSIVAPTGMTPNVQMFDLTAGAPTGSISFTAATAGNHYICDNNLKVTTGPMVSGHTYAVTLSNTIVDTTNRPVQRDAQFGAMLAATAPTDPILATAYAAYAPLRAYLATNGVDPTTIIDATVFTTQHATTEVPAIRTAVLAQPAPVASGFVRCDTGVVSPCDDGLTGAAHVRGCIGAASTLFDELQGQITIPILQQGTRPYSTLGQGAIELDANGNPVLNQGAEPVCVSITVPHGVTPPAGGWPVILYAHGTGGFYRSGILEGLAAAATSVTIPGASPVQFAFVGYDGVMTGPRAGMNVTQSPDTLFFNFANPVAARDNVLQGAGDVFALVRALQTVSLAGLPLTGDTTAFDPTQIYFIGHSQGSTVGLPASPFEPGLAGMVFSGAGGDLRETLVTKQNPVDIADLTPYVLEDSPVDSSHPVLNMFQAFFERSDAVNYGGFLLQKLPTGITARPLVQTYGIGDTFAPDPTMQAVASAIGLSAAGSVPGPNPWPSATGLALPVSNNVVTSAGTVTAALLEANPMGAYDGHFVLFDNPAIQTEVMHFLGTATTGTATIE